MNLEIRRQRYLFNFRSNIFVEDILTYIVCRKFWTWTPLISIMSPETGQTIITVKQERWLKKRFLIIREEQRFNYIPMAFWKQGYSCQVTEDIYEVYCQKGFKFSVYKNKIQIGWWEKGSQAILDPIEYEMLADNDVDKEILVGLCLVTDILQRPSGGINLGTLTSAEIPFDPNWQPR